MLVPLRCVVVALLAGRRRATAEPSTRRRTAAAGAVATAQPLVASVATPPMLELADVGRRGLGDRPHLGVSSAVLVLLTACCYVVLAVAFGANAARPRLAASWRQLRRDVAIGAIAYSRRSCPSTRFSTAC